MTHAASPWPLTALFVLLSACSTTNPDVVGRAETQRLSNVVEAVVLSTRPVVIEGSQSGIGSTAGGLIGGLTGTSVGGHREAMAVAVLGAVVGGVMGNVVERGITRETALEILVQLNNGDRRAVVQANASETFAPGDAVHLVSTAGKVRVTKVPTQPPQPASPQPAAAKT